MIALNDLLAATADLSARTAGPVFARVFDAIAYDSRTLRPGDLFVAVVTERADGHDFIVDACHHGAAGVLCERPQDLSAYGATCLVVDDTRAALVAWARFVLERHELETIAIGGSVGKTSTQQALVRALSTGEADDRSIFYNGNFNDLFGLPIALGALEPENELAILELASDRPGEMRELVNMARPRVAIVTNVAPVHIATLGSLEQITMEQRALVRALPENGVAILNGDDERVRAMAFETTARVLFYGLNPGLDLWASEVEASLEGLNLTIVYGSESARLSTSLLGFHNAYTVLAATAAALTRGLPLDEILDRLAGFSPLPGRLRRLPGKGGATILDDSQSASPRSLAAAIEALDLMPHRKIAVLGEISDLDAEGDGDEALSAQLAAVVDILVTFGSTAERLGRTAQEWGLAPGQMIVTDSVEDTAAAVRPMLTPGDVVLVKGSESARMERVVERLLENSGDAANVLVRQDPGWKQHVFLPRERPTWIEIDLAAIAENVERARSLAGPDREIMVVLKADAYGHGAVRVARSAILHGAGMGGVACLSEAVELREAGIVAPLLILGYVPDWQARDVVRYGLSTTIYSRGLAQHLSRAAIARGAPPVPVHIKVDTGMSRLGLLPADVPGFLARLRDLPGIDVEGIFTHFATADEVPGNPALQSQVERFRGLLRDLHEEGFDFRFAHADNSAALINDLCPELNLVRLGILLYGLDPSPKTPCPPGFRPALAFKTRIAQVKALPAGTCVSYGCAFVTSRPSNIAVIPVGYGDGFRRSPRGWGEVLVRGRRAPIAGNVCMDMTMLDVTDIPDVKEGDEVVLIGSQGDERITADDVARRLGTINYEVVTQILPRVPRIVP